MRFPQVSIALTFGVLTGCAATIPATVLSGGGADAEHRVIELPDQAYVAVLAKSGNTVKHLLLLDPRRPGMVVSSSVSGLVPERLTEDGDWLSLTPPSSARNVRFDRALGLIPVFHTRVHNGVTQQRVHLFIKVGRSLLHRGSVDLHYATEEPEEVSDADRWQYDASLSPARDGILVKEVLTVTERGMGMRTVTATRVIRRAGSDVLLGDDLMGRLDLAP